MNKKIYIVSIILLIVIWLSYNQITDIDTLVTKQETQTKVLQEVTIEDIEKAKQKSLNNNIEENKKIETNTKTLHQEENTVVNKSNRLHSPLEIEQLIYSSNIGNLIKINGSQKDSIKNITIWNNSFNIKAFQWEVFIEIDPYTIQSGKYDIIFHLENSEPIKYNKKILFWESEQKNLFISNITPNKLKNDSGRKIVLQWQWFSKIISIQLSNNLVLTKANF